MNDGFKQRLVGAVVLLSLALILWPLVFSDADGIFMDRTSQIPPTPEFNKYTVSEPVRPEAIEEVITPKESPVIAEEPVVSPAKPVKSKPVTAKPRAAKPTLDSHNLPEAWVLQVASFTKDDNAQVLTQALIKQGHKAYTRSIQTQDGVSTRVYIGPRLQKDAFDALRPKINKAYGVTAMVVRYEQ